MTNLYQDLKFLQQDLDLARLEIQELNKRKKDLEAQQKQTQKAIVAKNVDITNLERERQEKSPRLVNKILGEFLPGGNYNINAIATFDPIPEKNNELKIEIQQNETEQQGPCTFTIIPDDINFLLTIDPTTQPDCEYLQRTNPDLYNNITLADIFLI